LKKIASSQTKSKHINNSLLWLIALKVAWSYLNCGLSNYELFKTTTRALRHAKLRSKGMSKKQQADSVILFVKNRILEHPNFNMGINNNK
jgi:hypothetical protein